jgi:hypothetical protein
MDNDFDSEGFEYERYDDEKVYVGQMYSRNDFEVNSFDSDIYFLNFDL